MDLIAFGECLIDMLHAGGELSFRGSAGGAPCNVLAQAARLGRRCALVSMVGEDYFGEWLRDYLKGLGIDTQYVRTTGQACTTLAFVTLDREQNRHFSFYRKPGADMLLQPEDVPLDAIAKARAFVYGGVSLTKDPARSTLLDTLQKLHGRPVLKVYDPNLRFPLWEGDLEAARRITCRGMEYADVVKLSDEELAFLTGCPAEGEAVREIFAHTPAQLVLVTKGAHGCAYYTRSYSGRLSTYDTRVQDTTAAGDSFLGAFLHRLLAVEGGLDQIDRHRLEACVDYANAAGAVTASGKGAICSLPDDRMIADCQRTVPHIGAAEQQPELQIQ